VADDSGPLAAELRESLGKLIRRLRAEHGFPLPQGAALGQLSRGGAQTVSDLAGVAHMRPQSMAQTVRELEEGGYVIRRPDPDDGRRVLIELTDAGVAALAADRRRRDGWLAGALDELTAEERALLHDAAPLLRRIADS
jgi:DNA-binding MarR family transcriptional regulator